MKELLNLSSYFLKEAGLLKVPENLLKQIQDWALSVYFTKVLNLYYDQLKKYKKREILFKKILLEKEDESYKKILQAIASNNINSILPNDYYFFRFVLPFFKNDTDSETELQGVCDFSKSYIELVLGKDSEADNYFLEMYGVGFGDKKPGAKIIKEDNLTLKDLHNIFPIIEPYINYAVENFEEFIKDFETYGNLDFFKKEMLECKRYITEKVNINNDFNCEKMFEFLFEGIDQKIDVWVMFHFKDNDEVLGSWNQSNYINKEESVLSGFMDLYYEPIIPKSIFGIQNKVFSIKKTVRHELQHLMQTLITKKIFNHNIRQTEEISGVQHHVVPHMMPKTLKNNIVPDKIKKDEDLEHANRGIEYHTRITDSVDDFKFVINTLPKSIHEFYLKAWVGLISFEDFFPNLRNYKAYHDYYGHDFFQRTNHKQDFANYFRNAYKMLERNSAMFKSFKEHNFEKYKLAVKEFYKEVQDLI